MPKYIHGSYGGLKMNLKEIKNITKETFTAKLDRQIMRQDNADHSRAVLVNSPSSSLGCPRENYYKRSGLPQKPFSPRTINIFDNGHAVHDRIQKTGKRMGNLIMDEVPLINEKYNIQGHTDGIVIMDDLKALRVNEKLSKEDYELGHIPNVQVLEIKSINDTGFSNLIEPLENHKAQGTTYSFCLEQRRLYLRKRYKSISSYLKDKLRWSIYYAKRYKHINNKELLKTKIKENIIKDIILFHVVEPINKIIFLYENKNTQVRKEYLYEVEEDLQQEVLELFAIAEESWTKKVPPYRECSTKKEGNKRWCNYVDVCFRED